MSGSNEPRWPQSDEPDSPNSEWYAAWRATGERVIVTTALKCLTTG